MQNKELMDKLLGDNMEQALAAQREAAQRQKNQNKNDLNVLSEEENKNMAEIRIISAKYKVYIVLLLIGIAIFGLDLIPDAQKALENKQAVYNKNQSELSTIISNIDIAEKDEQYLTEINNSESALIECLDKGSKCSDLPESRNKDLSIPVSYLQASSLHSFKMAVDEKKVLRNLDTYLIRKEIGTSNTRVGDITRIVIGDPKEMKDSNGHFFEVPVSVTIKFENISGLTGFLYNIEKKIIENPDDRILYKIQSVSYDILASDEPQIADISMIAYYYYDERFENMKDLIDNEEITEDLSDQGVSSEDTRDLVEQDSKSEGIGNKVESFFENFFSK